jgi:copper resistance protein B
MQIRLPDASVKKNISTRSQKNIVIPAFHKDLLWLRAGVQYLFILFFLVNQPASAADDMPTMHMHGHIERHMHNPMAMPTQDTDMSDTVSNHYPPPSADEVKAAFPELHHDMATMDDMGGQYYAQTLLDRFEVQDADSHTALVWDGSASWGSVFNKLVVRSEGERVAGNTESLQTHLLWNHAITPWWDSSLGIREDGGTGPSRTWAAFGIQGLAPYFFEVTATAYVGNSNRTALKLETKYDFLLTNRLIFQPRLEVNAYGKDDVEKGIGSGLSESALGFRLRYEVQRKLAPYIGVEWSRKYGKTADFSQILGERTGEARAVAGLRVWF